MTFLKNLLADLVGLRLPVTAAALVALVVSLAGPFGVNLGGATTEKLTAALVAVGVVAAYVQSKLPGGVEVKTNPATSLASKADLLAGMYVAGMYVAGLKQPTPPTLEDRPGGKARR